MKQCRWAVSRRAARALAAIVLAGCVASLDAQDTEFAPHLISRGATNFLSSMVAVDIDADGDVDLVGASGGALDFEEGGIVGGIYLLENNGAFRPRFTARNLLEGAPFGTSLFVADVDNDSDLDIVNILGASQPSFGIGSVAFWLENEGGRPSSWRQRGAISLQTDPGSGATGDMDGDGDLDILLLLRELQADGIRRSRIELWQNQGDFQPMFLKQTIAEDLDSPLSGLFVTDVNGDGRLDVVANGGEQRTFLWFQNEGGDPPTFIARSAQLQAEATLARLLEPADLNGDGAIDMLVVKRFRDGIAWYENVQGDGSVWGSHEIVADLPHILGTATADMDLDGDLDILISTRDDAIWQFENLDGAGTAWARHRVATVIGGARTIAAVDVDGDGDIDVVALSRTATTITWHENRLIVHTNGASQRWRLYE